MTIENKTVLVTGSNRGIGKALVEEALSRGAKLVYAGMRRPEAYSDERVITLALDVTDPDQIRAAADRVDSLDVLVNNAGVFVLDDLRDPAAFEQHLAVNFVGSYQVTMAFLPHLVRSKGALVNNLSVSALAPLPLAPAYSLSKAAAFSLTLSLRALLARKGVRVHAVLAGPTDTEMTRGLDIPKSPASLVARAIFDGVVNGKEEIFPDPMSQMLEEDWRSGVVKAFERQNAEFVKPSENAA